jgi:hypothetical protein
MALLSLGNTGNSYQHPKIKFKKEAIAKEAKENLLKAQLSLCLKLHCLTTSQL